MACNAATGKRGETGRQATRLAYSKGLIRIDKGNAAQAIVSHPRITYSVTPAPLHPGNPGAQGTQPGHPCTHTLCTHTLCAHTLCTHTLCTHTLCAHTLCTPTLCAAWCATAVSTRIVSTRTTGGRGAGAGRSQLWRPHKLS